MVLTLGIIHKVPIYIGAVTLCNLRLNLSRNFVATQVASVTRVTVASVACLEIIKSGDIFVARSIARSRIRFYFSQ